MGDAIAVTTAQEADFIGMLRDLGTAIDGLFDTFLKVRCGSAWEGQVTNLRRWMMQTKKPIAPVFVETPA